MSIRAKGATEIRTIAGLRNSGVHSDERHVHQFQIATLELERSRRVRERRAALNRVAIAEARLAEIEALMRRHHEALAATAGTVAPLAALPEASAPGAMKGRKFRY